jgi:hypothetical protein
MGVLVAELGTECGESRSRPENRWRFKGVVSLEGVRRVRRISDSELWEHLDGRPGRLACFRLAARMTFDADLAARAAGVRWQNRGLKSIGGAVTTEPIPQRMRDLLAAVPCEPDPIADRRLLWQAGHFWLAAALAAAAGGIVWWAS